METSIPMHKVRHCLSKSSLNGRSGNEALHGETPDISIFRFLWFSPIWYYSPTVSFPEDKMKAGFFLDIAANTSDGFAYFILPVKDHADIPNHRSPVTLVRSVIRSHDISTVEAPRCTQTLDRFKFYNQDGDELVGEEELAMDKTSLGEHLSVSNEEMDSIATSNSFEHERKHESPDNSRSAPARHSILDRYL